jgi:hypothetical protein
MISFRTRLWFLIAAIAVFSQIAVAQQKAFESTELALEVHFYPKEPPAYQATASTSRNGAWYTRFGHIPRWVQPPNTLAVTAVNIRSEMAEDGVRIWVSVFLGQLHEQEKAVASYILRVGEKTTVKDLAQVGVEPFEIAVVRLTPSVAGAPRFISKASSIEVVTMQPNFSTFPSYNVVVRNVSMKSVKALQVRVLQEGRFRNGSMPQGKEGKPLALPAGTYEFTTRVATRTMPAPDGYRPVILPDQVIEISTAVFDDDSFEGESDDAVAFLAFQKGRKIQLARVVDLLQKSLDSASTTVDSLRAEVAGLEIEADSLAVQELLNSLSNAANIDRQQLKIKIQIGMKGLRDNVLEDISQFQLRNRHQGPGAFHDWLAASRDRYRDWLGRL